MAPKVPKESPQPKKSPAKPLKSPKKKGAAAVDPQALFLWTCFECSPAYKEGGSAGIDFAAVAEKLGIQKSAASMRFYRLKASVKAMQLKDKETKDEELKDKAQDLDNADISPSNEESLEV